MLVRLPVHRLVSSPARIRMPRRGDVSRPAVRKGIPPSDLTVWLGYWSEDDFRIVGARLVNLGQDGLLVIADGLLSNAHPVWLRLDDSPTAESVRLIALATTILRWDRCAVRFALPENCPEGFLERLVEALARWKKQAG